MEAAPASPRRVALAPVPIQNRGAAAGFGHGESRAGEADGQRNVPDVARAVRGGVERNIHRLIVAAHVEIESKV